MQHRRVGYVAIQFTPETNQGVIEWSHNLKEEDLVTATINGEVEGGNVTDKLHLTLFYGLDDEKIDRNELYKSIDQIELKEIKVKGLNLFPVEEYNCNVLHLNVEDSGELKKIHEEFKKFPLFSELQKSEYIPHVTIAYVKKDFKPETISQNLPKTLRVHKVYYAISSI